MKFAYNFQSALISYAVVEAVSSGMTTKHWPQRQRTQGEAAGLCIYFGRDLQSIHSEQVVKNGCKHSFVCPFHQDLALFHRNFQMRCCECFDHVNYIQLLLIGAIDLFPSVLQKDV